MKGFAVRFGWVVAQFIAFMPLWFWLFIQNRWGRINPLTLAGAVGLVSLVAVFGWIGSKIPFAVIKHEGKDLELPVDPLLLLVTLALVVLSSALEPRDNGTIISPPILFLISASGLLAVCFRLLRTDPKAFRSVATTFVGVSAGLLWACYEYLINKPHHASGIAHRPEVFAESGIWIVWCCVMAVWAAVYETTRPGKKFGTLLALLVLAAASYGAAVLLNFAGELWMFWLFPALPSIVASYRLLSFLSDIDTAKLPRPMPIEA